MKKNIIILVLLSFSSTFAQSAGNSGLSFLKIGFGARNSAMSDFGAVGAEGVTALFYNPALLASSSDKQIILSHHQGIQDLSSELIGASFFIADIPFAIGANTTSVSDIEIRTKPGEPLATFNANYFYGSLSTGFNLYKKFSIGLTAKYIYEGLFSDESTGWGFDLGIHYASIIDGLDFGASIRNLGSMSQLRTESTKLPVDFRSGLSYKFNFDDLDLDAQVIGGIQKYTATDDTHFHLGGEVFYKNILALRGGYMTGYDSKGLTAGLGLKWKFVNFDYAFIPFSYSLGASHIISMMFTI